jgi:hypothetical protein
MKVNPYKRTFIIRTDDNIPLHAQDYMTLNEAIQRYNREIATDKKLGLYDNDNQYNIYDTRTKQVVL